MQFCDIHKRELKNGVCPLCRHGIKKEEEKPLINVQPPGKYDQFGFKAAILRKSKDKKRLGTRKSNKEKFLKIDRS